MKKYISTLSSSCSLGLLVGAFGCSSAEFTVPNTSETSSEVSAETSPETDASVGNDSASSTSSSRSATSTSATLTTDSGTQDSQNDSASDSGAVDSVVTCQTYSITDYGTKIPSNLAYGASRQNNNPLTVISGADNTKTQKIFENWGGCFSEIDYNLDPWVIGLTYSDFSYIPFSKIKSITAHLSMQNAKLSIVNKQIVITPMYKPSSGPTTCIINPSLGTTQIMTSNEIVLNSVADYDKTPFTGIYISFVSEDETGNNSFYLDQLDINLCN